MNKPSPIRKDCSAWKRAEGSNTRSIAILAGLIVVLILVVGTIWNGRSASRDTEQAVRSVSLLYLVELAGRREQVVSSNLDNNIEKMNAALSLLTDEDLSDAAHLQAFQTRMKKLYHLEKFAFVDADGLIGSISRGIIVRSVVQTALTILVLSAMTVMIISQLRRNARLVLEKETGEAESRVKRQELEEKLALQEALLAREARDEQQRKLITALAADYWSVYYIELDRDEGVCYQAHKDVDDGFRPGDRFRYLESVTAYANQYITEPYRDEFMRFIQPEAIREGLKNERVISYRYMVHRHGRDSYEMVRFAGVRHPEDREDHLVLEKVGVASDVAISGTEAVEMVRLRHARRDPYRLILIDWQMPGMDGVETTRQIRSVVGEDTAIVILTAYKWDDVYDEAMAAGVDSFLPKPLFASSVLEEFEAALKKRNLLGPAKRENVDLNGRRILLAEDVAVNAEIMTMMLQMRGMAVEHAPNGRIAVEMFASHPERYYDAVLMDIRMPEMDGLEATARIRAMDRSDAKTVPIIALTANAFDEDVQRSLQAGMNAHLSKPVEPESLFETLESLVGG